MISANPVVSWERAPVAEAFTKPDGARAYRLRESFLFTVDGIEILIRAGHTWDDASIPRAFRILIGKDECGIAGPCIHDYLYQHAGRIPEGAFSQKQADAIFRSCMRTENVSGWRGFSAHAGLRLGGWIAWRKYERNLAMRAA